MQLYMVIALVIAILSAVFAVQNTAAVTVNFLGHTFESSLAVVLLLTFAAGCFTSLCISIPTMYLKMRRQRRDLAQSEPVPPPEPQAPITDSDTDDQQDAK